MHRRFRLIVALGMSVVLATCMLYVGLRGGDVQRPVLQARELSSRQHVAMAGRVQVDGIAAGPVTGEPGRHFEFFLTDRDGGHRTRVSYRGSVPDAFRVGRNVIVDGQLHATAGGGKEFRAVPNSLVTKCPSKFESDGGSARSSS